MTMGKHTKCLELASEALDIIQSQKYGAVSSAIRKLELCARLLDDTELKEWCDFHLGGYAHKLPKPPENLDQKYSDDVVAMIKEIKIPVSQQEILYRLGNSGGGFESIEIIEEKLDRLRKEKKANDGKVYISNLLRTISACRNATSKKAAKLYASFAFGDIPRRQFDTIRDRVDNLLLDICPDAVEKFMSAYEMLGSKSSEDWSLALTSCRRIIKAVADTIYPPTEHQRNNRKLGEEQYINRLWAFLDDNMTASSDKDLAKTHVDYLGSFIQRLNDKASKGVHSSVTYEEAVRAVLYTYLTLGDILEFAAAGVSIALSKTGKVDINSATYDELCAILGITPQIAKEIIKQRTKEPFSTIDKMLDIKGLGSKTLDKIRVNLIVLPSR